MWNCNNQISRKTNSLRFECGMCDFCTFSPGSLRSHKNDKHKISIEFACSHAGCNAKFSRKSDLTRHVESKHVRSKQFIFSIIACTFEKHLCVLLVQSHLVEKITCRDIKRRTQTKEPHVAWKGVV